MTELVPVAAAGIAPTAKTNPLAPYVPPGSHLDELISGWLLRCKSDLTRDAYRADIVPWLDFCAKADLDPLAANDDHVTAHIRVFERTPTTRGKPPAGSSVSRHLAVMSSFYRHCLRREVITRNPVEHVDRPQLDRDYSATPGLTQDEAQRLIQATDQFVTDAKTNRIQVAAARDAAMIAVMLCTGGRVAEVTNAQIEDLGYDRGHRVLFVTRKGGKRQPIALGESARIIDRHVANERRTEGLVFRTSRGKPVNHMHIYRVVKKAALAAHLPAAQKLTPHSLRHTFATLAFDNGADINDVQDAMGHADPRTTRRYDRARNRLDRSPVHAISKALVGGGR